MSERRRRKNPRFLKEKSDRSGFDSWHRTDKGDFVKDWVGIKQGGLLLEPEEFDMPPPSNKPLGGADISGIPLASAGTVGYIYPSQEAQVQYMTTASQVTLRDQIAMYVSGSNTAVILASNPQVVSGGSNQCIAILGVGSGVTFVNGNGLSLRTSSFTMDSGAILNLTYNDTTWYETSRDHMYYSLGAL